jgi:alanyl-tRNA synthetase
MQSELRTASKERARLLEQLAAFEARELYDTTAPAKNDRRVHVVHLTNAPVASLQTMAQQFILGQQAVFIASSAAPAAVLIAASEDSGLNAGGLLREGLQQVGGRGGGTPRVAQGSAPSAEAALACASALETLVRE